MGALLRFFGGGSAFDQCRLKLRGTHNDSHPWLAVGLELQYLAAFGGFEPPIDVLELTNASASRVLVCFRLIRLVPFADPLDLNFHCIYIVIVIKNGEWRSCLGRGPNQGTKPAFQTLALSIVAVTACVSFLSLISDSVLVSRLSPTGPMVSSLKTWRLLISLRISVMDYV